MSTINIVYNLTTTATVTAVSILNAIRSDTAQPPAGVSFPISMVNTTGNTWAASFTDTNPPAFYTTTNTLTLSGGIVSAPFAVTVSGSLEPASGFWTNQQLIERYLGSVNADLLSNLNNTGTGADPTGFADAISAQASFWDYMLAQFLYPTSTSSPPFPTNSYAFPILQTNATRWAAAWLYTKRGVYDEGAKGIAGDFQAAMDAAEKQLVRVVKNRINGIDRGVASYPAVILNPTVYGYGTKNPLPLSADMIPELP